MNAAQLSRVIWRKKIPANARSEFPVTGSVDNYTSTFCLVSSPNMYNTKQISGRRLVIGVEFFWTETNELPWSLQDFCSPRR